MTRIDANQFWTSTVLEQLNALCILYTHDKHGRASNALRTGMV
jgi:hypothetical protein